MHQYIIFTTKHINLINTLLILIVNISDIIFLNCFFTTLYIHDFYY